MVQLLEEQAQLGRGGEADLRINYDGFAQVWGRGAAGPGRGEAHVASTRWAHTAK